MFLSFVDALREAGIPASIKEHLVLIEALERGAIAPTPEAFYYLSRATFVKDESLLARFDRVFGQVFAGLVTEPGVAPRELPEDWLRAVAERYLPPSEMEKLRDAGSWDEIMAALRDRLREQAGRHEGGSKWIGTGGTSPFGHSGFHPAGVRIGGPGGQGRAMKVWERREFENLDPSRTLGRRNIQVALRRLRRFAREGAALELDLDGTVQGTARRGWLDLRMRPERHNAVKVLLFLDVGGSMDPHVRVVEELFGAAHGEFRNLEFFYFHNCPYEGLWRNNRRRWSERIATQDVLHRYGRDYKAIFVGDAAMSPYELSHPGGSVEHHNAEAGATWLTRIVRAFPATVWLNPVAEHLWGYTASTRMVRDLVHHAMFPLTPDGLGQAMRQLSRRQP